MYSRTDVCYIMESGLCHLLLWFNSLNLTDHNVIRMQVRNKVSYIKFTVDIAYMCMLDIVHSYVFIFGSSILWVTFFDH